MSIAFDPDYPTPAALAYRDAFIAGAAEGGLHAIPGGVLSLAIDRAIERGVASGRAGKLFADAYFKLDRAKTPRGGIDNPIQYLLGFYSTRLQDKSGELSL